MSFRLVGASSLLDSWIRRSQCQWNASNHFVFESYSRIALSQWPRIVPIFALSFKASDTLFKVPTLLIDFTISFSFLNFYTFWPVVPCGRIPLPVKPKTTGNQGVRVFGLRTGAGIVESGIHWSLDPFRYRRTCSGISDHWGALTKKHVQKTPGPCGDCPRREWTIKLETRIPYGY